MVGTARLSVLATVLERDDSSADLEAAERALPGLERCDLDTVRELESGYLADAVSR